MKRSGHSAVSNLRKTTKGETSTKSKAGRICASVRAVWEENQVSSAACWDGAEDDGAASAMTRRRTTATAITTQTQNPMRSQSEGACSILPSARCVLACVAISTRFSEPTTIIIFNFTSCQIKLISDVDT